MRLLTVALLAVGAAALARRQQARRRLEEALPYAPAPDPLVPVAEPAPGPATESEAPPQRSRRPLAEAAAAPFVTAVPLSAMTEALDEAVELPPGWEAVDEPDDDPDDEPDEAA